MDERIEIAKIQLKISTLNELLANIGKISSFKEWERKYNAIKKEYITFLVTCSYHPDDVYTALRGKLIEYLNLVQKIIVELSIISSRLKSSLNVNEADKKRIALLNTNPNTWLNNIHLIKSTGKYDRKITTN